MGYETYYDEDGKAEDVYVKEEPDCYDCCDTGRRRNGRSCASCDPNWWQRFCWAVSWRVRRAVRTVRVKTGRDSWDEAPF